MEIPIPKIKPHMILSQSQSRRRGSTSTLAQLADTLETVDSSTLPPYPAEAHEIEELPEPEAYSDPPTPNLTERFSSLYSECFKREMMKVIVKKATHYPDWRATCKRAMKMAGITPEEIEEAISTNSAH